MESTTVMKLPSIRGFGAFRPKNQAKWLHQRAEVASNIQLAAAEATLPQEPHSKQTSTHPSTRLSLGGELPSCATSFSPGNKYTTAFPIPNQTVFDLRHRFFVFPSAARANHANRLAFLSTELIARNATPPSLGTITLFKKFTIRSRVEAISPVFDRRDRLPFHANGEPCGSHTKATITVKTVLSKRTACPPCSSAGGAKSGNSRRFFLSIHMQARTRSEL